MSKTRSITITCPACRKDSDFVIWESINTVLNPEMKSAVRDRSAFLFICPECGAKNYVDYGFLYHQMEDRIMIHYASSDKNAEEIYDLVTGKTMPDMMKEMFDSDYLIRIVRSQNQFREKVAIFDAGLDDRIIEIFKIFLLAKYQEGHPEGNEKIELLYFIDEGKHLIQVFADNNLVGVAEIPMEFYEKLKSDYSSNLPDIRKDEPFIDRQWAIKALELGSKEKSE